MSEAAAIVVPPVRPWIGIAAMSENRVIGCRGSIPWYLPSDFAWFKRVTSGHILLMGRKTFESIGRPLPGRRTLVVTRTGFRSPNVECVATLEEVLQAVEGDSRRVFLSGGSELYSQWLARCSDLLITHVKKTVEGDAFFPEFEDRFETLAEVCETHEFRITHYFNRRVFKLNGQTACLPAQTR